MKTILAASAAALLLCSCSSIVEGTSETLSFDSNPPGADCALERNSEVIGSVHTPGGVLVKKTKYDIHVTCKKDGYQDATAFLHSDIEGATWGNIILGGGIGWAIDSASGADNKYAEHTTVTLVPIATGAQPAAAAQPATAQPVAAPADASKPTAATVEERLKRLDDLKSKGLITQQEYDRKRQAIINGI